MNFYFVMNAKGQYYGPGGWVDSAEKARPFSAEDALQMLRAFAPKVSIVRASLKYTPEQLREHPDFVGTAA